MDDTTAQIVEVLRGGGVKLEPGLSESELAGAECSFGFRFPPDLRALLGTVLPDGWADWRRRAEVRGVEWRLEGPIHGVLFDIKHNVFWWEKWGPRPASLPEALEIAERSMRSAPKLIPVFSHRYIPSEPCVAGNPVLSVVQTDIIIYGADLLSYVRNEWGNPPLSAPRDADVSRIPYWGELIEAAWDQA